MGRGILLWLFGCTHPGHSAFVYVLAPLGGPCEQKLSASTWD
jgi:hypothetical protein